MWARQRQRMAGEFALDSPMRRRACAHELQLNTPRACSSTRDSALHPYSGLLGSVVKHAVTKSACHGASRSRSGARLRASQSFRRRSCAPGARQCASPLRQAPAVSSGRPNPLRGPRQPASEVERPWIPHEQRRWPREESNLRTRIRRLLAEVLICRGNLVDMKAARHCARHSRVSGANDGGRCGARRPRDSCRLGRSTSAGTWAWIDTGTTAVWDRAPFSTRATRRSRVETGGAREQPDREGVEVEGQADRAAGHVVSWRIQLA
jgi:hypothetical protein